MHFFFISCIVPSHLSAGRREEFPLFLPGEWRTRRSWYAIFILPDTRQILYDPTVRAFKGQSFLTFIAPTKIMSYCFKTCSKHQTKFHLSVSALQTIIIKTIIYMLLHINTREMILWGKSKVLLNVFFSWWKELQMLSCGHCTFRKIPQHIPTLKLEAR